MFLWFLVPILLVAVGIYFLTKTTPNHIKKYKGKVIVITGASSGIGEELALQLSEFNPKLVISARREDKLNELGKKCKQAGASEVLIVPVDVAKRQDCKKLVDMAIEKFGTIDVLFLNAGVSQACRVRNIDNPDVMEQIMRVNYFGATDVTFYALDKIREAKGHICVTSSVAAVLCEKGMSSYSAAKAALHGFFDTLRLEEAGNGVKVTLVCPGFVPTDIVVNSLTGNGSAFGKNSNKIPFKMPLKPAVKLMVDAVAANKMEQWYTLQGHVALTLRSLAPNLFDRFVFRIKQ